tara:strand:+ start:15898 stop:16230 length:333 start_codon:yes stop_codon:yes gene_type:complete
MIKQRTEIKVRNIKVGDIIEETREETYYNIFFGGGGETRTVSETTRYYVQGKIQSPNNMHASMIQLVPVRQDGSIRLHRNTLTKNSKGPTYAKHWMKSKTVTLISRKEVN